LLEQCQYLAKRARMADEVELGPIRARRIVVPSRANRWRCLHHRRLTQFTSADKHRQGQITGRRRTRRRALPSLGTSIASACARVKCQPCQAMLGQDSLDPRDIGLHMAPLGHEMSAHTSGAPAPSRNSPGPGQGHSVSGSGADVRWSSGTAMSSTKGSA